MTVKYSLDLSKTLKPGKRKSCQSCGLYLNQPPASIKANESQVFWVGLSAVKFNSHEKKEPLSALTRSGALIEKVEIPLRSKIIFYKTNLVKCLPLKADKIRYPLKNEMEKCYSNLEEEMNSLEPSVIFLLGKQVANFIIQKHFGSEAILDKNFNYKGLKKGNVTYVPVHHPSYILVYKRKALDQYIKSLRKICKKVLK